MIILDNDIFKETTRVLKDKYLKNKDEFDNKRNKLTERNNRIYPGFVEKQKELIRDGKT